MEEVLESQGLSATGWLVPYQELSHQKGRSVNIITVPHTVDFVSAGGISIGEPIGEERSLCANYNGPCSRQMECMFVTLVLNYI